MSRIGVAGGTGLVGRHVMEALRRAGHEAVALTRASGVDLVAGDGLADALRGVRAVIDVTNTPATDADGTGAFFGTATRNLLAAEERAGSSITWRCRSSGSTGCQATRTMREAAAGRTREGRPGCGHHRTRDAVPRVRRDGGELDPPR